MGCQGREGTLIVNDKITRTGEVGSVMSGERGDGTLIVNNKITGMGEAGSECQGGERGERDLDYQ